MAEKWIKCSCGSDKFKISQNGKIFCANCMKPLKKTTEKTDQKTVRKPKHPFDIDHPDIKGPAWSK